MTFSLTRSRIDKIPRKEIIEELKRVANDFGGEYFTGRQFNAKSEAFTKSVVINEFGSWSNALQEIGVTSEPRRKPRKDQIPERDLFAELERIWQLLGHRPSRNEWEALNPKPRFSYTTYKHRFAGWTNACLKFIEYKSGALVLSEEQEDEQEQDTNHFRSMPSIKRRTVPDRLRLRILDRDGYACVLCGRSPALERGVTLHLDHIQPFSRGGETTFENLQTLCQNCNLGKGATDIGQAIGTTPPHPSANKSRRRVV